MRVVHLITGLGLGGAEAILSNYVQRDSSNEHSVISITDAGFYGPRIRESGTPVIELGAQRREGGHLVARLAHHLREARPEVLFAWMYHAHTLSAICKLANPRCRIIWGLHASSVSLRHSRPRSNLIARINGPLSRLVPDIIVSCSSVGAKWHRRWGYRGSIMRVIPNGLDTARFFPDPDARFRARKALMADDQTFLIGYVARFDPQKDHANLVSAMACLNNFPMPWRLVLAGTGLSPDNKGIMKLLVAAGISDRCTLLGEVTDVPSLMNALDLHVMSSAYGEAFPGVICEAMACGTPVVTTDVGDSGLIVGDCGVVVPTRSPTALAAAIRMELERGPGHRSDSTADRIRTEFSLERMVAAYASMIHELET